MKRTELANKLASNLDKYKDEFRLNLIPYIRKAFQTLPPLHSPNILDVGCGSGVPTMELAKLCGGRVTGIDIDERQLKRLELKIKAKRLSGKVEFKLCSMLKIDFPDSSFDIIWAEGSIASVGFDTGLKALRHFLKTGGFFVVHDDLKDLETKISSISKCGYKLIDYFTIDNNIWWKNYYAPLEQYIVNQLKKYQSCPSIHRIYNKDRQEIEGFYKNPDRYQSVYFIMSKN